MNKYLSVLGYLGPNILLFLILFGIFLQKQRSPYPYLIVIGWQMLSHLFNVILKNTIRAPRPDSDKDPQFAHLKPTLLNYMTIHRHYGMPSGHAQATISELIFIAFYFKKPWLTAIALLQTALTLWQRYKTRRHSIEQLAMGSAVGSVVGLLFYQCWPMLLREQDRITSL
jgi:membrane-associated phospholipid phosphatase